MQAEVQFVPTHDQLLASLGQPFTFGMADGRVVEARLAAAPAGIAMDDNYVCYSATFDLPAGHWLPQDTYRVTAPDGAAWDLFVTPTRPNADGSATMTAVMHCLRPTGEAGAAK